MTLHRLLLVGALLAHIPAQAEDCNSYAPGVTRNNCLEKQGADLRWRNSETYRRMQQWADQVHERSLRENSAAQNNSVTPNPPERRYATEAQIRDQLLAILAQERWEAAMKPRREAFAQAREARRQQARQLAENSGNSTPELYDRLAEMSLPEPDETYAWTAAAYGRYPERFTFRMALAQTLFCPKASYEAVMIDGQSQRGRAGRSCQGLFQPAFDMLLKKNSFRQGDTLDRVLNCGVLRFYQGQADKLSWNRSLVAEGRFGLLDSKQAIRDEKPLLEAIDSCESGLGGLLPNVKDTYLKTMWELGRSIGDRDVSAAKVWLLSSRSFWEPRSAALLQGNTAGMRAAVCEAESRLAEIRRPYAQENAR